MAPGPRCGRRPPAGLGAKFSLEQAGRGPNILSFSRWQSVGLAGALTPAVLAEILDGGQSFRWLPVENGVWEGRWLEHCARVRLSGDGDLQFAAPLERAADTAGAVRRYFDAGRDVSALTDQLPWRSDPHLARTIAAFPGLRILRQPFGETLLCFLCSAAKQIVQIKQIAAALAQLTPGGERLPGWPELARIPEATLRTCKLGFRAAYVHQTAAFLALNPGWLKETETLPYAEAKERLLHLPGVGEKVADCVLLFGAGRLEAFPVDVWIIAAMSRRYGLTGWTPMQIAHFGRVHFGGYAGLAQQYLFAWERRNASIEASLPA